MKPNRGRPWSVAIIEGNPKHASTLQRTIQSMGYGVFGAFQTGESFFEYIENQNAVPDLLLMDIHLKGKLSGLHAATRINNYYNIPIIMIPENLSEVDYSEVLIRKPDAVLLKPIRSEELKLTIQLIRDRYDEPEQGGLKPGSESGSNGEHRFFFLKVKGHYRKIYFNDILWVEGSGSYTEINTLAGGLTVAKNLKDLELAINHSSLIRIHRSYMVNIDHVNLIKGDTLMVGWKSLPLSRNGKQLIRELYNLI